MKVFVLAAAAAVVMLSVGQSQAAPGWDGGWQESGAGGSSIELPSYLFNGPSHMIFDQNHLLVGQSYDGTEGASLSVRQYEVDGWTKRAYVYLAQVGTVKDTIYRLDKVDVGILTGQQDGATSYYGICRSASNDRLICVDMTWNTTEQSSVMPIVTRIEASFPKSEIADLTTPESAPPSPSAAMALDVGFIEGKLTVGDHLIEKSFGVSDNTEAFFHQVSVECGFFDKSGDLVASGSHEIFNVAPHGTAYGSISVLSDYSGAISSKCRSYVTEQ